LSNSPFKIIAFLSFLISSVYCYSNDTILIRNNEILDIQFEEGIMQLKDDNGCYAYLKYDWIKVANFPTPIQCPFRETFNSSPISDSLTAIGKTFYAISNTLIEGCQDYSLTNSFPSKITSMCTYDNSQILVGTADNGMFVCKGGEKQSLFISNLDLPENIKQLEKIGDDILINTGNSIQLLNQNRLDLNVIYTSRYPLKMELDALQHLWILDGNKLICNSDYFNADLLECSIQDFKTDSDKITRESKIDISYFNYYPKNQSEVEYSYRLDGGQWHTTKNESVHYQGLAPGQHSFEVRSSIGDGLYSLPKKKDFRVEATIKDSIWPIIFGLTGLLLLGFLFALRKQNTETKELERSRDKLQLENELLKSRQKVLELQMNPHFLFNTLNSIQGLIALKKNKEARQYLKEFSQMMRSILQSSREEHITIGEEIKFLKNYMSLEKMARNDKFDFEVIVDDNVNKEKHIPVMILQALLENAIIHGVGPLHEKGHIVLKLKEEGGKLNCAVMDNGVGMDAHKPKEDHKSYARAIIKERLRKYKIKDVVYSIPESGKGVKAAVSLPFLT